LRGEKPPRRHTRATQAGESIRDSSRMRTVKSALRKSHQRAVPALRQTHIHLGVAHRSRDLQCGEMTTQQTGRRRCNIKRQKTVDKHRGHESNVAQSMQARRNNDAQRLAPAASTSTTTTTQAQRANAPRSARTASTACARRAASRHRVPAWPSCAHKRIQLAGTARAGSCERERHNELTRTSCCWAAAAMQHSTAHVTGGTSTPARKPHAAASGRHMAASAPPSNSASTEESL
jgi:hypothetical protein